MLGEHRVHRGKHRSGLDPVGTRAHSQVDVRGGDAQVGEEDVGEHRVVVLPGVDDDVLSPCGPEGRVHGSQLDELGAGTDDRHHAHRGKPTGGL